ncbi:hypothetical protein DQ04_02701020 [Trypanosoma grayi]|uniref:hypothetical protein n=1 Tax=Trypanosoma grayi TaxID=71804 RepID=UPI0004F3F7FA|nr:hypothetical protein DQ04_02701020 [Trypanosoma grayi]KEG11363.1 hypothetical protein DQ04_02701020 [Trypanosoma grayi]
MQSTQKKPEGGVDSETETSAQLVDIQKELEALKQRRMVLEEQRRKIFSSCGSSASANGAQSTIWSQRAANDTSSRNCTQVTRGSSGRRLDRSSVDHSCRIPSEAERLKTIKTNVYREMKDSMRKSWEHDSALIMGSFLADDNPRACTFGRERRFVPIVDQKGQYYLSTDVEAMSRRKNQATDCHTVSRRGERGMNISNHWNDLQCSGPPGPGAYTPRYGKLAKPSVLTRR